MKIASIHINNFKRFSDFNIEEIPQTAKLVILTGPNGSGKSSLFEAFNFWARERRGSAFSDPLYFLRNSLENEQSIRNSLQITFHDFTPNNDTQSNRKCFYIRSAYRHETNFNSRGLQAVDDVLNSPNVLTSLIHPESRIGENYNRIVGEAVKELFDGTEPEKTKLQIRDRLIGQVRTSMSKLFADLLLSGTGNPTSDGTFMFDKGAVSNFHFKNLSGGEKAAFDLLLDFIVKNQTFDNTVFCIDEPELHLHTRLQGKLLEELFKLLPNNCQLWISTHSIGMARKAAELFSSHPGEVIFIDFHDQNFDQPVTLIPKSPDRGFWKNMFETALDDLAELVVPSKVVFCEGKRIGQSGRNPAFDSKVYSTIFNNSHPDTDFVSLGGANEVQRDGIPLGALVLRRLAPGIKTWCLFDLDDRSAEEVAYLNTLGIHVLHRRDLENYLWDDEIITKLAVSRNSPSGAEVIKNEKARLLAATNSGDDVKDIRGVLYNFCKATLSIPQGGNDAEAFARDTLAKLVTEETDVYKELEQIIFS